MIHPLFDLSGRVALVTGAARGLGRAIATAFAEVGANLLITDINAEGLQTTASDIEKLGVRVIPMAGDITSVDFIRSMYTTLDAEFHKIDVLANVAGPTKRGDPELLELEQLEMILHGLVVARFCSCQEAGRRMLAVGKGSIINICSIGGVTALGRGNFAYGVSMGGVAQMTRELSTEWSSRGVRVNAILPAQIINPGLEARMREVPDMAETFLRGIPMGRLGQPDDIKGMAIFLASDASAWVTGALMPVDGGNLALNAGGSIGGSMK